MAEAPERIKLSGRFPEEMVSVDQQAGTEYVRADLAESQFALGSSAMRDAAAHLKPDVEVRTDDWRHAALDMERAYRRNIARLPISTSPLAAALALPEIKALVKALDDLRVRVNTYRNMHDLWGDADQKTGRSWDLMRRAEYYAAECLNYTSSAANEHDDRKRAAVPAELSPQEAAEFVITYLERETGVPFGDMIGRADAERIKAAARRAA